MIQSNRCAMAVAAVAVLLAIAGCSKSDKPAKSGMVAKKAAETDIKPLPPPERKPLHVKTVGIGNKLTSDGTITHVMETFTKTDRIIGLVELDGYGKGSLTVKWLPDASSSLKPSESTIEVDAKGWQSYPHTLENVDTWPIGEHGFEVLLNGKSVATKKFTVK